MLLKRRRKSRRELAARRNMMIVTAGGVQEIKQEIHPVLDRVYAATKTQDAVNLEEIKEALNAK